MEHINLLAQYLAEIIPSTTYGKNSISLENLAKDWRLSKYFMKQRNKALDMQFFLKNVFRYKKRIPKQVIIEIIKQGMQWKANQGEIVEDELLRKTDPKFSHILYDHASGEIADFIAVGSTLTTIIVS